MGAVDPLTSEALHELLVRLHEQPSLWHTDPDASQVLAHCRAKYAALARVHGQEPDDVMGTAFVLLRADGILNASDPWGYLTHGIRIALASAELGDALMCGRDQASHLLKRRSRHDVARFGEHEHLLAHVDGVVTRRHLDTTTSARAAAARDVVERITADSTRVLAACGWEPMLAASLVDLVVARVVAVSDRCRSESSDLGDVYERRRAHENLRHDRQTPTLFGLPHKSWCVLVTALLGSPADAWEYTASGQGLLLRLASGISVDELLCDERVVDPLVDAAPDDVSAHDAAERATIEGVLADA